MTRSHDGEGQHVRQGPDEAAAEETAVLGSVDGSGGRHARPDAEAESRSTRDRTDKKGKPKKKGSFWKELPILIVVALVLTFLIQTFVARVFSIPSGSMEQTLHGCPGCTPDRILVDRITYDFTDPSPGDVVVFRAPDGWDQSEFKVDPASNVFMNWLRQFGSSIGIGDPPEYDLVKRVIAVGGQTVSCCDAQNRVLVDGKPLNEPYIYYQQGLGNKQAPFKPVRIPQGQLWVMGDNRNNSYDSRYQNGAQADPVRGTVPVDNVIGKARLIIWPPSRWQGVRTDDPHAMSMPAPPIEHSTVPPGAPLGAGFVLAVPAVWTGRKVRALVRDKRGRRR